MITLNNGLKCFKSPITWLAIGLLLFNDQLLKVAYPSWLTGKLSDFAGLFVFPFIVAIILGLVLDRVKASSEAIGRFSFVITGLWFFLMKTIPFFTAVSENIWSQLAGSPANVVRDPTDLIALVILIPAWKMWNRQHVAYKKLNWSYGDWKAWIALCVGSLASLASSCDPPDIIQRIVVDGENIYVGSPHTNQFGIYHLEDGSSDYSRDLPPSIQDRFSKPVNLPLVDCVPENPNLCYQIDGTEKVEVSSDGGKTWEIGWQVPKGRREFMERMGGKCEDNIDMGPYDLTILNHGEDEEGYIVLVALGNEGILVRNEDGQWLRDQVLTAYPTPYALSKYYQLENGLGSEILLLLALSLLVLIGLFSVSWKRPSDFLRLIFIVPAFTIFAFFLSFIFPTSTYELTSDAEILLLQAFVLLILWFDRSNELHRRSYAVFAAFSWFISSISIFLIGILPLFLWVNGTIPYYSTAVLLTVVTVGLILLLGSWLTLTLMRSARGAA